jgi:hypothetical protein
MKLARLCLLNLEEPIDDLVGSASIVGIDKSVQIGPVRKTVLAKTFFVPCTVNLKFRPKITKEGLIVVPRKSRELAEQWLEHFSNLVAVSRHIQRKLVSADPPVALVSESVEDDNVLSKARGFLGDTNNKGVPSAEFRFDTKKVALVRDRLDGLAILAEALGHKHETGRFHELIRLFESAFALSGKRLVAPLGEFLAGAQLGYSNQEVLKWANIRNRVTHADRRSLVLFEADVAWVSRRMMQAAYDVLLNKEKWGNISSARRNSWRPVQGTTSMDADIFITKGSDVKISIQIFDEFRRFPAFLGSITELPDSWWSGPFVVPGRSAFSS